MSYNIRKNWIESFSLIVRRPVILLPFLIIAFLEGLALQLIYFSPRKPIAIVIAPLIRKFSGGIFLHYPHNLTILPKLLNYAQEVIYVFCGVLLIAISVNIVKNIRMELPLKTGVLIRNALRRYTSFFTFGLLMVALFFIVRKLSVFLRFPPYPLTLLLFLFNIILQIFVVFAVPAIVIKKKGLFRALGESIILATRNFLNVFILISLPFLIYLPITLLKTGAPKLINKTFPEISLYIAVLGILVGAITECFIIVCATGFFLDKEEAKIKE
jgi:hypothetical protein